MKAIMLLSLLLAFCVISTFSLQAQECLHISKTLPLNEARDKMVTVNELKMWFIENTNAIECTRCQEENMLILDGHLPLTLSDDPFELEYEFNGEINYRLIIDYSQANIKLTFEKLRHQSNRSLNGLNLNYGYLLSNGQAGRKAIYRNFDYLIKDHRRIKPFESDLKMAKRINEAAVMMVEDILATK